MTETIQSPILKNSRGRNELKLEVLALLGREQGANWYSIKQLQNMYQKVYKRQVRKDSLYRSLRSNNFHGVVNKHKGKGTVDLYRITQKGISRLLFLVKNMVPDLLEGAKEKDDIQTIENMGKILQLASEAIDFTNTKNWIDNLMRLGDLYYPSYDPEWVQIKQRLKYINTYQKTAQQNTQELNEDMLFFRKLKQQINFLDKMKKDLGLQTKEEKSTEEYNRIKEVASEISQERRRKKYES